MAKSVTIKAALITGGFVVLAAIIGLFGNSNESSDIIHSGNFQEQGTIIIKDSTNMNVNINQFNNLNSETKEENISLNQGKNDVFSDVNCSYWAYTYIMSLSNLSVMNGYPDRSFKPEEPMTRAGIAKSIVKYLNLTYTGGLDDFPDVPRNHSEYHYIMAAKQNGIIIGYIDGTFRPDNLVLRAETTVMIIKAKRSINKSSDKPHSFNVNFSDVSSTDWVYPYVIDAMQQGIIKGYPDGTFRPDTPVTRAEGSVMIQNIGILVEGSKGCIENK